MKEMMKNQRLLGLGKPPRHMDTPKEGDGDGTVEDDPSKKQPKRRRQRCRSKSRQNKYGDSSMGDNNTSESAEENPL